MAWWRKERLRRLTNADIGQVFRRVVDGINEPDYLLLFSIGPVSPPVEICSFITFQLQDQKVIRIGDTGYANGQWYNPVEPLPPAVLREVKARHDERVQERLRDLNRAEHEHKQEEARARAICGRSSNWNFMGSSPVVEYDRLTLYLWLESRGPYWIDFVIDNKIIATKTSPCSHDPIFGIEAIDHKMIFGKDGVVDLTLKELHR